MSGKWTPGDATEFLLSRELFGIKPGLERMRLLVKELGNPQDQLRTIHVVGTNGKSSTTRYAAALLCQMGVPAGAYISPHLIDFNQRVLLPSISGGSPCEVSAELFAGAVERVASAEQRVAPKLPEGDVVTQFELVTAAALLLISESGAEVAVLEAGLGGRLDATNILNDGGVVALTGISLDHTRWLGESVEQIAAEKLAVLRTGGKLAVGESVTEEIRGLARERARLVGAQVLEADPLRGVEGMAAFGDFQTRNLSLAVASVELLEARASDQIVDSVAANTVIPGRLQRIDEDPTTFIDSAHNLEGISVLAGEVRRLAGSRKVIGLFAVLDDKDAIGMLAAMLQAMDGIVVTEADNPRSRPVVSVEQLANEVGFAEVRVASNPMSGLEAARLWAGRDGFVIAAGSVHLAGDLLAEGASRVVTAL